MNKIFALFAFSVTVLSGTAWAAPIQTLCYFDRTEGMLTLESSYPKGTYIVMEDLGNGRSPIGSFQFLVHLNEEPVQCQVDIELVDENQFKVTYSNCDKSKPDFLAESPAQTFTCDYK